MKQLNLMLTSIVLTCFALCPATTLADDELEVFIEVFDHMSDIEGEVTEMHGPGEADGHGDGDQGDSDDLRAESDDYDSDEHDSDDMHTEGDEHEAGDDEIASFGDDGLIASASDNADGFDNDDDSDSDELNEMLTEGEFEEGEDIDDDVDDDSDGDMHDGDEDGMLDEDGAGDEGEGTGDGEI